MKNKGTRFPTVWFSKGTQKDKGQKGTTGGPRNQHVLHEEGMICPRGDDADRDSVLLVPAFRQSDRFEGGFGLRDASSKIPLVWTSVLMLLEVIRLAMTANLSYKLAVATKTFVQQHSLGCHLVLC